MTRIAFLFVLAASSFALAQPARLPVPDGTAVEKSEKLVRELYKADFAKKKQSDQFETARKLIKAAGETNDDPAAKFVLYREASELAARSGDLGTALEAGAGMIQSFDVKATEVQLGILGAAERGKNVQSRAIVEASLEVVDDALRADDYETAGKLLKLAAVPAARISVAAYSSAVKERSRETEAMQQTFIQLAADRKKLESDANDPGANFKVGRFLAVLKGDWDAALPMLAKGSDEKWKAASEQELLPASANDRAALADKWFDLAATLEGPDAVEVRFRAYQWYSHTVTELTGLSKTRVEKRMAEMEKSAELRSANGAGWRVIFRSSDPAIWNTDTNRGRYQFALPVAKAPVGIRYLRMAETVKGTFAIIEMKKDRLDTNSEKDGFAWSGKNNLDFNGRHLGIGDTAWNNWSKGAVTVFNEPNVSAYRGWGFGNRANIDDVQGYGWGGESVPRMVFEIAVKVGPLTPEESKRLLKKKK